MKKAFRVDPVNFIAHCELHGILPPEAEYAFDENGRGWRFDFAWPGCKLALEIDGGIWSGGAHVRASRMLKTWEKENEAVIQGWRILRCLPKSAMTSHIIKLLKRALPYPYANVIP